MRYRIVHTTAYQYAETVGQCLNMAYVMPRNTQRQHCVQSNLRVTPLPVTSSQRMDYYGNLAYHFSIEVPHKTLEVTAESVVEVKPVHVEPELEIGLTCAAIKQKLATSTEREDLLSREFVLPSPLVEFDRQLREFGSTFFADDRPFLSSVFRLNY